MKTDKRDADSSCGQSPHGGDIIRTIVSAVFSTMKTESMQNLHGHVTRSRKSTNTGPNRSRSYMPT